MRVEARIGWFRDRVLVDDREYEVGRGPERAAPYRRRPRRCRARAIRRWWDRISVDSPCGPVDIRFRRRSTTFHWRGRLHRIGSTVMGRVAIFDAGRTVAKGVPSWSGFRIEMVSPELRETQRELVVGLGLRVHAFATAISVAAVR